MRLNPNQTNTLKRWGGKQIQNLKVQLTWRWNGLC